MMMMDRWKMRYCDDEQSKIGFLFISLKLLKKRNHLESFYVPCNPRGKWSRIPLINHHQRLQAAHYSGWWSPNPAHLCCWEPHHQRLQAAHYSARRSPLPLSTCGDQEDGRWSTPGWRSLGEDRGGGFSTNLFTFSKGKVSSPKLSKLFILLFVFVSSAWHGLEGESTRVMNKFQIF